MHQHVGDGRREPAGVVEPRGAVREARELHRGARIEDDVAAEVRVRLEFADEELVRPRKNPPVEELDVIPRRVFPVFGKLDGSAARRGPVQPVDRPEHRVPDIEYEARQASDDVLVKKTEIVRGVSHASGGGVGGLAGNFRGTTEVSD